MKVSGHVEKGFEPVAAALGRQIARVGGGGAVCVYFRGTPVVDVWAGERAPGVPWERETPAISFSTSKGVTATALHRLADRGLVDYDAPVARYWPEFARAGKEAVTLRHVLSHRAGLYNLRDLIDHGDRMLDWRYMIAALEKARPAHEPGAYPAYHGLTYGWLVGEVIERVSGMEFSEFVQREVVEPLGLEGMWIGAPADACARAAALSGPMKPLVHIERMRAPARAIRLVSRFFGFPIDLSFLRDALLVKTGGEVFWDPKVLACAIPAANGLFTARALARMYAALACGGMLDGKRFLSEATVDAASTIQTRQRDRVILFRPGWRLGFHGAFTTRGALKGGFGHFGFGGSGGWADPKRELAMGFINNRAGGTPLGDLRVAQIGSVVVGCVKRLAPGIASAA